MNDYTGHIYCTAPTLEISRLILTDSAHIQKKECEKYNLTQKGKKSPIYPIYGQRHVEMTLEHMRGYDYDKPIVLNEYITIYLKPTGHLLGACSVYIEIRHEDEVKTLLFSGDTSANKDVTFTKKPDFDGLKVSNLFIEGTYGNKVHQDSNNDEKIANIIRETCIKNKGQLVIPVFSVGRSTQILAKLFDLYKENGEFNDIPIYLASPMSCNAHAIYMNPDSFNFYNESDYKYKEMQKWDRIEFIDSYAKVEDRLFNKKPCIIAVSAGMISGGYSVSVASSVLPNNKNTIMFIGYQGLGTLGRTILESEEGEEINIDSKKVKRKCNLEFVGMSSHADYKQMILMIKTMRHTKMDRIFLNHGEKSVLHEFKTELENEFNCEIIVSEKGKSYSL